MPSTSSTRQRRLRRRRSRWWRRPKRRADLRGQLEEEKAKTQRLEVEIKKLREAPRAADGAALMKLEPTEHQLMRDSRHHKADYLKRTEQKNAAIEMLTHEKEKSEQLDVLNEAKKAKVRELQGQVTEMQKQAARMHVRIEELVGTRDRQIAITETMREKAKSLKTLEDYEKLEANYEEQLKESAALRAAVDALKIAEE